MGLGQHDASSEKATCHDALVRGLEAGDQQGLGGQDHWWEGATARRKA